MSDSIQVRIAGVGIDQTLTVPAGSTLDVAIGDSDASAANLQARVNGESVDPSSYELTEDTTAVLVPPAVKLG